MELLMACKLSLLITITVLTSLTGPSYYVQVPEGLAKGQIIERVVCQNAAAQSYALYLPSNYTPDRKWPILYCFDYIGDGKLPVRRFKEGAERYGYIVAGSNNSRNGVIEHSLDAFKAVWADTHTRFSVNDERVYTAGFSGGARIASLIASFYRVEGVIACGAGFQAGLSPGQKTLFTFFATVGSDDFNFPEMKSLEKSLNKRRIVNRLVEFEGWHTWAPTELCMTALGWMEIHAMKRHKRDKDEALINSLFNEWLEEAIAIEQNGRPYEAYLRLKSLAADFNGLKDVSAVETMVANRKKSDEVSRAVKEEEDQARKQKELEDEIWAYTDRFDDPETQVTAFARLQERIRELRRDFEAPNPSARRRVVRRALTHLFEILYERGTVRYANNYPLAIKYLEIAVEINPVDTRASYRVACMYSMKGEKKKALAALKSAVDKGFVNLAALETNKELDPIRQEVEFQRILARLRSPQ
jgi:hypothetical protein